MSLAYRRPVWGFDLDGTVLEHELDDDRYCFCGATHPTTGDPIDAVCRVVRQLHRGGAVELAYVTGRCECRRETTLDVLARAGLPPAPLFCWPGSALELDLEALGDWKASILRGVRAAAYVGDQPHDQRAARLAEAVYVDPDQLLEDPTGVIDVAQRAAWFDQREVTP